MDREAVAERALSAGRAAVDAVAAAGAGGGSREAATAAAGAQEALRRAGAAVAGLREAVEDLPEGSEEQDLLKKSLRKHQVRQPPPHSLLLTFTAGP